MIFTPVAEVTPVAEGLALPQWTVDDEELAADGVWRYPGERAIRLCSTTGLPPNRRLHIQAASAESR